MSKSSNGKGDKPRPVNLQRYEENYEKIFVKRKTMKEWQKHFDHLVLDFSGFREYNSDDLLTEEQYKKAFNFSKHE